MTLEMFKNVLKSIIAWRLLLLVVIAFTLQQLPIHPEFIETPEERALYTPSILSAHAHFEGFEHLKLIEEGYSLAHTKTFIQPLYPTIVKFLSFNILNAVIVGSLLSTVCFVLGLLLLYKLIRLDETQQSAQKTLWLTIAFPTAFLFTALYPDGLYFFLSVATFYFARRKQWWVAGLCGLFATLTQLTGIILFPVLLLEYASQPQGEAKNNKLPAIASFLPLVGFTIYLSFMWRKFGFLPDFTSNWQGYQAQAGNSKVILIYQVFYRYIRMLIDIPKQSLLFYRVTQELSAGLYAAVLGLLSYFKLRRSYALYALLSFLFASLSGTFSGIPRLMLVLFPLQLMLTKSLPQKTFKIVLIIFAILQIINLTIFTQGKLII